MSSDFNSSRRQFLKRSAGTLPVGVMTVGFLEQFLLALVQGLVNKAEAEVAQVAPRNYFHIHLQNGWNRTVFDSFLRPTAESLAADRFQSNVGVATTFNQDGDGNIIGSEYRTFHHNGVNVPWLWQFDLRSGSGGRMAMSELLQNMGVIRGFSSGFDGHEFNMQRITFPEPSGLSLSGALADKATRPFSALAGSTSVNWFRSGKGAALSYANFSGNALTNLRKAFDYTSLASTVPITKKSQYNEAIEKATNAIKTLMQGSGPQASALKGNLENADKIISGSAEDLTTIWNSLVLRYKTVINDSVNPAILYPSGLPGLFDAPVLSPTLTGANLFRFSANGANGSSVHIHAGQDIRRIFTVADGANTLNMTTLANHFAIAEYLFTRELSSIYTVPYVGMNNLNFKSLGAQSGSSTDNAAITQGSAEALRTGYNFDEHDGGSYSSLLAHSCAYRGLAAGILEFAQKMKRTTTSTGANLWEETLIHLTGDFARAPKASGLGTDHGWWGHNTSIFSGAIKNGPVVTGNIQVQNRGNNETGNVANTYSGTWGAAAKVTFGTEKEYVTLKHVLASIAQVLRLDPNPWPFNNRLWNLDGDQLKGLTPVNLKVGES